jgi:phage terminase Nu1 subunit (DNA packaging protein)
VTTALLNERRGEGAVPIDELTYGMRITTLRLMSAQATHSRTEFREWRVKTVRTTFCTFEIDTSSPRETRSP